MKTFLLLFRSVAWLMLLGMAEPLRADSWTYWGQVNTPATNSGSALAQMTTDGTNFYYATLLQGVWRASFADLTHTFTAMPMTGFPLWDANTNTNGFAVWSIATTPQGTLVIAGSSVNVIANSINDTPNSAFTNSLPVFYWWDETNLLWHAASVTGKTYPYTAAVANFANATDGSLWTGSGFSPYAYHSLDGGHSYTAIDIDTSVPTNYFPMPLTGDSSVGLIFALVAGPNNHLVIGTETGGYLQTTNNGALWTSLDPNFTNANSVDPLGRVGNATVTGVTRFGDFLCNNKEFVASFPAISIWSGVTLIGYHPADNSYYEATNGLPANYLPLSVATPPSGESFTFANQIPSLQYGIYRSPDGSNWTQFNTGISALNAPTGRGPGVYTATLGNLVFVSVLGSIYYYDSTPPPITNLPPVATVQNVNLTENSPSNFTLAGSDADGNSLTFSVVASPTNGTLSGTLPNLTYTPAVNYTGTDRLLFTVNDGITNSAAAVVNFSVNSPTNSAPAISFIGPANSSYVVEPTNIVLSASAGSGIQQVNFYNGTNLLTSIFTPPYTFTWTNPAGGDYTLNALAVSQSAARAWAQPVTISILSAVPLLSVQPAGPTNVVLTWPLPLQGFYVQSATSATGPWSVSPYVQLYYLTGQTATMTIGNQQFFRLVHPH